MSKIQVYEGAAGVFPDGLNLLEILVEIRALT